MPVDVQEPGEQHSGSFTQQNLQQNFHVFVGVSPQHVNDIVTEGRELLEQSRRQTAHAEQVAVALYNEACEKIRILSEVIEKLQNGGSMLESQLFRERESFRQYEVACEAQLRSNDQEIKHHDAVKHVAEIDHLPVRIPLS